MRIVGVRDSDDALMQAKIVPITSRIGSSRRRRVRRIYPDRRIEMREELVQRRAGQRRKDDH